MWCLSIVPPIDGTGYGMLEVVCNFFGVVRCFCYPICGVCDEARKKGEKSLFLAPQYGPPTAAFDI